MAHEGGVVAVLHAAVVDGDAEEVVEVLGPRQRRRRGVGGGGGAEGRGGVREEVEALEREVDEGVDLGGGGLRALGAGGGGLLEALQVHAEHVRQPLEGELLRRVLQRAAARAPVLLAQPLLAREGAQAGVEAVGRARLAAVAAHAREVERHVVQVLQLGRRVPAPRAAHLGAQLPAEDRLQVAARSLAQQDARAVGVRRARRQRGAAGPGHEARADAAEDRDPELVRVLLLVAGEVVAAAPHRVEEGVRAVRRRVAGEALRQEYVHLAGQARPARRRHGVVVQARLHVTVTGETLEAVVPVAEKEARDERAVHHDLEDAVHEAPVGEGRAEARAS